MNARRQQAAASERSRSQEGERPAAARAHRKEEPPTKDKEYYTIGEVGKICNISAKALRYYDKIGVISPDYICEENGYRYYNTEQIHRIMGICLYRRLHVSIAEIKRLVEVSTLEDISDGFSGFIDSRKKEIARLTLEVEQMSYMKQHLDTLDEGSRTISIQTLPAVYPLYHQDSAFLGYRTLKDVFHSPLFSMGNFSYILSVEPSGSCQVSAFQFAIREPMLALTQLNSTNLPSRDSCRCLYTVVAFPTEHEMCWDLSAVLKYAGEHQLSCKPEAYAFYVFSIAQPDVILDYYEVYLPLEDS